MHQTGIEPRYPVTTLRSKSPIAGALTPRSTAPQLAFRKRRDARAFVRNRESTKMKPLQRNAEAENRCTKKATPACLHLSSGLRVVLASCLSHAPPVVDTGGVRLVSRAIANGIAYRHVDAKVGRRKPEAPCSKRRFMVCKAPAPIPSSPPRKEGSGCCAKKPSAREVHRKFAGAAPRQRGLDAR